MGIVDVQGRTNSGFSSEPEIEPLKELPTLIRSNLQADIVRTVATKALYVSSVKVTVDRYCHYLGFFAL